MLNAYLLVEHGRAEEGARMRDEFVAMFREEWRLERGDAPLQHIAIVDDEPAGQFLTCEFALFKEFCSRRGIARIADPREFRRDGKRLLHDGKPVDLIYNRLTDFALDATVNRPTCGLFSRPVALS